MNHLRMGLGCCLLLMATVLAVASETPPRRKSGLWEIKTTVSNAPNHTLTAQTCVDQNSDDLWEQNTDPDNSMSCSKPTVHREGSTWVAESVCKIESSTATSRSVFTGSFDSSYRVESTSTYIPPLMGMKEATTIIDVMWLGPCKPGQTPGDILVPDIERMKKMMQGGGGKP